LPHHEYDRTVADFDCQGLALQALGKRIVIPGWRALFSAAAEDDEEAKDKARSQILPPLEKGSGAQVLQAELKAMQTQPPKPYTEGDLIKAMKTVAKLVKDPRLAQKLKETTGIGTEATRASIIQGLIDREFLVKKGKAVRASEAGVSLINAVPPAVADPGTTAIWEQALDMIESGTLTLDAFIMKQGTWIASLVQEYSAATLNIKPPETPKCPLCTNPTARRKGPKGDFYSCTRYPECKGVVNIETGKKRKAPATRAKTPRS
jgi:DNA topoisomerase-3